MLDDASLKVKSRNPGFITGVSQQPARTTAAAAALRAWLTAAFRRLLPYALHVAMATRPELVAPPEVFYNEEEARKCACRLSRAARPPSSVSHAPRPDTSNSHMIETQARCAAPAHERAARATDG